MVQEFCLLRHQGSGSRIYWHQGMRVLVADSAEALRSWQRMRQIDFSCISMIRRKRLTV